MNIVPYKPFHVELMRAQGGSQFAQLRELSHLPVGYGKMPAPNGPAVTAFDGDRVVLCGGIVRCAPGRGDVWALVSEIASSHMTALHYATKRFLEMERWRRLEASVLDGFDQGCRWVRLLGFEYEGTMRGYGLNGETYRRYGRVR